MAPVRAKRGRDALRLEVFHHLFAAAAEEMGAGLMRASFSPNIKERRDFSCALFDSAGRMVSQAAHIPIHLGSMPLCVRAVLEEVELRPGDAAILNDPFRGGTHLPDVTLVSPVFLPGARWPDFYCANRAHHADVGGPVPGSMAPARDVHGEGLRIPPLRLVRGGEVQRELLALLLANLRVPREREGDLLAQASANRLGARRLEALSREHGRRELVRRARALIEWTADLTADLLRSLPAGRFRFEDSIEIPGRAARASIRLTLEARGGRLTVDLRETDDQVEGGVSTVRAVALSAVFYCLRLLLPAWTATNDGVWRHVRVLTRPGSLVDARYPAAVAAGNVETSQRIVDVILGALAQALPGRIPAASSGTMSNLSFGGVRPLGEPFSFYETIAGGAGASPLGPGEHAVHTHMTNTRNTPIEALERSHPVRVLRYAVRRGSGGAGARRGGDGVARSLLFLEPAVVTWVADRSRSGPWGLAGGRPGARGVAKLAGAVEDATGAAKARRDRARRFTGVPSSGSGAAGSGIGSGTYAVRAGAILAVATPGGGGHGRARAARRRPR